MTAPPLSPLLLEGRAGLLVSLCAFDYLAILRCVCGTLVEWGAAYYELANLETSDRPGAELLRCPACGQRYALTLLARPVPEETP